MQHTYLFIFLLAGLLGWGDIFNFEKRSNLGMYVKLRYQYARGINGFMLLTRVCSTMKCAWDCKFKVVDLSHLTNWKRKEFMLLNLPYGHDATNVYITLPALWSKAIANYKLGLEYVI